MEKSEAIELLEILLNFDNIDQESIKLAIASLKAWDKVIRDINGYIEYHKNEINKDEENRFLRYLIIDTYINALATIDNHLSEVKNG